MIVVSCSGGLWDPFHSQGRGDGDNRVCGASMHLGASVHQTPAKGFKEKGLGRRSPSSAVNHSRNTGATGVRARVKQTMVE